MNKLEQVKYVLVRWLNIDPSHARYPLSDLMNRVYWLSHRDKYTEVSIGKFELLIKEYYLSGGR